jgi:hypothetical protein
MESGERNCLVPVPVLQIEIEIKLQCCVRMDIIYDRQLISFLTYFLTYSLASPWLSG